MPEVFSQPSLKRTLLWYWGPVLLYGAAIFYLSAQSSPGNYIPGFLFAISDKVLHAIEFGLLGILLFRAFFQTLSLSNSVIFGILGAIIFGASDEFHQWFVPNRQADIADLLADSVGATLLVIGWAFWKGKKLSAQNDIH